jgi:multicomponent Na+:H+ antiporter subunit C
VIIANYIASFVLIALGFYTIVTKKNLIKIVIGMGIVDYGVNLLIVSLGFNAGGTAPIFSVSELDPSSFFVDPIPQALTLTSIVIGACVTAMALSLVMKMKQSYGTLNTDKIRRLHG